MTRYEQLRRAAFALANAVDLQWTEERGLEPNGHLQELVDIYRTTCSAWVEHERDGIR